MALLALLLGCGSADGTTRAIAAGASPARKVELPWLVVPGGRMRTTFFYGPWQCSPPWMTECQKLCVSKTRQLKGCMWLADMKLEWVGHLIIPPVPLESGGRLALTHCCCDSPALKPQQTEALRKEWENARKSFRQDWSKKFGDWPTENGKSWPGHHIEDLGHGGPPTNPNNILPTPPDIHDIFSKQYPVCYAGGPPWNTVGPERPYTDN
jgi:hypothetical protein